jgi:hypothetical protein
MAYTPLTFSLLANAGKSPDLWSYNTTDLQATVLAANYFGPSAPQVTVGDYIFCRTGDAAVAGFPILVVATTDGISQVTTLKVTAG